MKLSVGGGMRCSAFRAALRIARRDALRHKSRSLLVIALIGLPVLVLAAVDVGWRTYELGPEQRLDRGIGAADLAVRSGVMYGLGPGAVFQTPESWLGGVFGASGGKTSGATRAALAKALPARARVITERENEVPLAIRTAAGVQYAPQIGLDYADPIARGMVTQLSGRAPRAAGEAAITAKLAAETGLTVGDTITMFDRSRSFAVVGIVRDSQDRNDLGVYTLPSAFVAPSRDGVTTWFVDTPAPVSWAQVRDLNRLGFVAVSRYAYLNPPAASQLSDGGDGSHIGTDTVSAVTLVAGMALLELVLLAGPAFAVSARRQRRELALIAATGGRRRDLRNVVLANGIVLGLTAGVVGVGCGIGLSAATMALFGDRIGAIPGPFDVRPMELAVIGLVSLVTAMLAALVPARAAARLDVVAALAGRRGEPRVRRRVPVIGIVVVALGIGVALFGASAKRDVNLILAGVAVIEVGLIVLTPTLITLVSRLGRWLPFAPRLALRDATRNRSSAAPAVAAVMAATIGAIAITIVATSQNDLERREYQRSLPTNLAYVPLDRGIPGHAAPSAAAVAAVLRADLAPKRVLAVTGLRHPACSYSGRSTGPCTDTNVSVIRPRHAQLSYRSNAFGEVMVDDGTTVSAMFGAHLPQAEAALRAGRAVVADGSLLRDGKVTLRVDKVSDSATGRGPEPTKVAIPATPVQAGFPAAEVVLPPSMARSLTGAPQVVGVAAVLSHPPTAAQRQAVDAALLDLQPDLQLEFDDGFRARVDQWVLYALVGAAAVIALGAAAVATMLANVDGRADLVTLGAVGASPRTRRIISISRAGMIAGLGGVIGTAAGFVPAIAWIKRQTDQRGSWGDVQLRLVVPWPLIALLAVGVPLLAMLIAGAFSRSGLPSERRGD